MKLTAHSDVEGLLAVVGPRLMKEEERNSLILSIASRLEAGASYGGEPPLFFTVEEAGQPIAAALRTPPYNLIVYCEEDRPEPLEAIAERLLEVDPGLPGVIGVSEVADRFSRIFSERTGCAVVLAMRQRLYSLREVVFPVGVPGRVRAATGADVGLLSDWIGAFHDEATPDDPPVDPARIVERFMTAGKILIWEDGGPVSMAGSSRGTANGATISAVYTPPEHRGNGYASGCVAALSRMLLEEGKSFCTLFTDLSNPTSNRIYQRIGYRPVIDYTSYSFAPAEGGEI